MKRGEGTSSAETPTFKSAIADLDRFWFGYGSPLPMGVFRLLMGGLIMLNQLMILPYWSQWFSEKGFVPAWAGAYSMQPVVPTNWSPVIRFDPLVNITTPSLALGTYLVVTLASILTFIGLWTRVSSVVLALGILALQHRNSLILHGGDTVIRICAIYIALAPSGLTLSVDALRRGTEAPMVSQWPRRLVQFNMALLYFTATWAKYFGKFWKSGIATYFPARLNEFKRFPVPGFFNDFPMVYMTTYGTLLVEFSLAVLVWFKPFRKWALLGGVLLHGFIEYSMNIPLFSFLMMSMYVVWYDGDEIDGWYGRMVRRFGAHPLKDRIGRKGGSLPNSSPNPAPTSAATSVEPLS